MQAAVIPGPLTSILPASADFTKAFPGEVQNTDSFDDYKRTAATTAMQDYTIDNLPNPPELLPRDYVLDSAAF